MLLKNFKVDNLDVQVYDTREAMGKAAAAEAVAYLKQLLSRKDEIYMIFAAAPSQNEFLAAVAEAEGIDWGRIHALHMDEYVGLPSDAPQGFGNFLRRAIFDKVPFASVDYIGTSADTEATIARYEAILSAHHVDVVFMGIGENGHIAFNDPHVADFNDPKLIKKVDDRVQKLIKEGKKVELKKVELPTRNSLTAYYTVDGVEHVETFDNK